MNPFGLAWAEISGSRLRSLAMALLIGLSVAISVGVASQERSMRAGSARAAAPFDLVIGAPGSPTQLILSAVYLQPAALPLLPPKMLPAIARQPGIAWAAPLAFGDTWKGRPIIGTSIDFVLQGGKIALSEGRPFARVDEAVAGAATGLDIGATVMPSHGVSHANDKDGDDDHAHHNIAIRVVGKLPPSGTPWDRAILVPVEQVWRTHALPDGHRLDDGRIGPPWDGEAVAGVPAIVVKPKGVADAYRLRNSYRTAEAQGLFPAEVLIDLYRLLGNVSTVILALSAASHALVLIAILVAATAIVATRSRQIAALRAMGAPRLFVFASIWSEIALILVVGLMAGVGLGYGASALLSRLLSGATAIDLTVSTQLADVLPAAMTIGLGLVLAAVPAIIALSKSARASLQT